MALSAIDFLAEDGRVNVLEQLLLRGRQREDGLLEGLLAELRAAAEDVLQEVALAAGAQEQHAQLVADVEEEVRVLARVLAHAVRQRADSAGEADVLNVAMFGMTARMWREQNPGLKGNIRDYASINELICLSNMENLNAVFIDQGIPQGERLVRLNRIAIQQMRVLEDDGGRKLLE